MNKSIPLLKVAILGDGNVGKTSLVRRYCEDKFSSSRVLTIGVDFQTKVVELPEQTVKLSIWDVAGQDRFRVVRENMYRGSLAAVLTYDLTDRQSLQHLRAWHEEITEAVPNIKYIIIGNKMDLLGDENQDIGHPPDTVDIPYLRTSALSGEGVSEMFELLAKVALKQYLLASSG